MKEPEERIENKVYTRYDSCCSKPCRYWYSCNHRLQNIVDTFFGALGKFISSRPWITILFCLTVVGLCSAGFYRVKFENRTVKLFVPQESRAMKDLAKASEYFPALNARDEFILFIPENGGNALEKSCLQDIIRVHNKVISLPHYTKFCSQRMPSGKEASSVTSCIINNPLEIFDYNVSNLVNISAKISAYYNDPTYKLQNGKPMSFSFNQVLSNVRWNKTTGLIQSADTIQVNYLMRNPSDEKENLEVIEWEKTFINKIESLNSDMTCMSLYYAAERSLDDAIAESSGSDISLISITFTLMISFACFMLGKFTNPLTGHSVLANVGILAVALGILAGFGLTIFIGVPFISIVGVLPFLILGIGIDDMFIIVDEIDRQDRNLSFKETVQMVMSQTGATVTMTTLTDLVAFAVSTLTDFPSVRYFCCYAALSITFSYLMMVTFFVAFVSFDVRRIKANRRDCLPICLVPSPKQGQPDWDEPRPQSSNKIMTKWAKFLMLPPVRFLTVVLSLGLLAVGIYGAWNISDRFNRTVLAKDDSYFKKFITEQEKHYETGIPVSIVIEGTPAYETKEVQEDVIKLSNIAAQNKHYKNLTISWMFSLKEYSKRAHINMTGKHFLPALHSFLNHLAYSHFSEDIVFTSDNKTIKSSRIICYTMPSTDSTFQKDAMVTLRKDLEYNSELSVYPVSKSFIYFEQYVIVGSETLRNLIIAALSVLIITCPFLMSFSATLLIFFGFVSLVVELFGLMYFWDVSLNSVSMINLVMAIGFSVDYSAHIAMAFTKSTKPTVEERVEHALSTLGASVIMGGASTFLGMIVTAFAASEIFRIFFKMFFGIVVFGLLHGLCFLPVYLSLAFHWQKAHQVASDDASTIKGNQGYPAEKGEKNRATIRESYDNRQFEA